MSELTPHERAILALVAQGLTNREISERLYRAEQTIRNTLSGNQGRMGIYAKIGVRNRVEATRWVLERKGDGPKPRKPEPTAKESVDDRRLP